MGLRGLCRSSHSLLEPLRIILAQLKETPLLQQAHRMNLAERSLQKYFQRGFGPTSGQYFGTTLFFLSSVSLMGHLCPTHFITSCIHPREPSWVSSDTLREPQKQLHEGDTRDEAKRVTKWKFYFLLEEPSQGGLVCPPRLAGMSAHLAPSYRPAQLESFKLKTMGQPAHWSHSQNNPIGVREKNT